MTIQHGTHVVGDLLWNPQPCFSLVLSLFCLLLGESCPQVEVWVALVRTRHAGVEQELRRLREEACLLYGRGKPDLGKGRTCKDVLMVKMSKIRHALGCVAGNNTQAWWKTQCGSKRCSLTFGLLASFSKRGPGLGLGDANLPP